MDRFVCVRIVQGWGLDLSLFQFDWRQTWMVFLMNSEKAIYGRYDARQADDLVGLRKALEGALELHEKWPANKQELAGKVGPALRWKRPEEIPSLKEKGMTRPVTGRDGCIHCQTSWKTRAGRSRRWASPFPSGSSRPIRLRSGWASCWPPGSGPP